MEGLVDARPVWLDNHLAHEFIESGKTFLTPLLMQALPLGFKLIVLSSTCLDIENKLQVLKRLLELDSQLANCLQLALLPDILRLVGIE